MQYTINSRRLGKAVTFSQPANYYIFVDLNGREGTLGQQICVGGKLSGSTIGRSEQSQEHFERICKRWFKAYLLNL